MSALKKLLHLAQICAEYSVPNKLLCCYALLFFVFFQNASARASVTILVGEPYGSFGTMMPVGHTAAYLDRVCADGPLRLRRCGPEDAYGVVVARYASLGKYDWMAVPLMDFLYATEAEDDVPVYATASAVWQLREQYRARYLQGIVPDGQQGRFHEDGSVTGAKDLAEWWETAGMAYNRRVWGYQVDTTAAQDEAFLQKMNAAPNRHRYRLRGRNCANFAADVVNFFYPDSIHPEHIADFGLMTPKQVVRSLSKRAVAYPEMGLKVWQVPQVPGTLRRSRPVRGAAEGLLKTKRYLFTLLAIQPEVPACLLAMYLSRGRWKIGEGADAVPGFVGQQVLESRSVSAPLPGVTVTAPPVLH